jgi:hypothetical protein
MGKNNKKKSSGQPSLGNEIPKHQPTKPFSGLVVRSDPAYDARCNAKKVREEMMPNSFRVTDATTAEGFFGLEYMAANGEIYSRCLTHCIAQINNHEIGQSAFEFHNKHYDQDNPRGFIDLVHRPVQQLFTQAEFDAQGPYGLQYFETVLTWIKDTFDKTEKQQMGMRQTQQSQHQAHKQATHHHGEEQVAQDHIQEHAVPRQAGEKQHTSQEQAAPRQTQDLRQFQEQTEEAQEQEADKLVRQSKLEQGHDATPAIKTAREEGTDTVRVSKKGKEQADPHSFEPSTQPASARRIVSEEISSKAPLRGGQRYAHGAQAEAPPVEKYHTLALPRRSPFPTHVPLTASGGYSQKLQDAFAPAHGPAGFHNQPGLAHLRLAALHPQDGNHRYPQMQPTGFYQMSHHQMSQDRFPYVPAMPHMQHSNLAFPLVSPVPLSLGMVPVMGPGGPMQPMIYGPSKPQHGMPPNMPAEGTIYPGVPPQPYPNFKIPIPPHGGRGMHIGAEAYMRHPQNQYGSFNSAGNHGFGRGGMGPGRGRGGRGGRNSMSGNNYHGRREPVAPSRVEFNDNGSMSRDASFSIPSIPPVPRAERRNSTHERENRKPTGLIQGTERFPEYTEHGYVPFESTYVPHANLPPSEQCLRKSIGADVETMTSLWVGNVALGTTIDMLRTLFEEKLSVGFIKDFQRDGRSDASWTFVE